MFISFIGWLLLCIFNVSMGIFNYCFRNLSRPLLIIIGLMHIVHLMAILYMATNLCTDIQYLNTSDNIDNCDSLSSNIFFKLGYQIRHLNGKENLKYRSDWGLNLSFFSMVSDLDLAHLSFRDLSYSILSYSGLFYNVPQGNQALILIIKHGTKSILRFIWEDLGLKELVIKDINEFWIDNKG